MPMRGGSNDPRDGRPSPDALLSAANREERRRGRLKVFLGAAPGVGKTYEMLTFARSKARDGVDVAAAVVETHGRSETAALLDGLDTVPMREVDYQGSTLREMDLDAVLARRPAVALVDELAHTNAPGSRHPKRYQDVEELLDAGIDVLTTLNIQHVESLNDVVAQITKIRVRETVPDGLLDRADDIEIVDLNPDDLIQRLLDGKVYAPPQAERALKHYFSPGNLTALRELALRRTAQRVDSQLLEHMRAHAISGPWAAGERVLVCVSEDPQSAGLVRYAKRLADRFHAPWTALVVESPRTAGLGDAERDRIAEVLRLAERLGGEAVTLPGDRRIADEVMDYARAANVTHIVIGKSARTRWFEILHGSVVHDLVRKAGDISVHVIAGKAARETQMPSRSVAAATDNGRPTIVPYLVALLVVGAALGIAELLTPLSGSENVDLVFLAAIVGVAAYYGLVPALLAVAASSACYNFFFLPPLYTFTVADPRNVVALVLFTAVAIVVSNMPARMRGLVRTSQGRARTTQALYSFSRKLAGCGALDDVLWVTAYQIASMLRVRVVLLLPEAGMLKPRSGYPPEDDIGAADLAAATWAFDNNREAGRDADTLPGAKRLFLPMRTGRGTVGVVGIDADKPGPLLTVESRRLLDALSDQAALAIERVNLVEDLDRAARAAETDKLRQALLTSISHDLRTPLASVLGAASTLRDLGNALDEDSKSELVTTVIQEAERLNRFIANLLDMTRLEAGAVAPKLDLFDIGEIVEATLRRCARILVSHNVEVDLQKDLPPVEADPVLLEQVLFNLLDNAAKYSDEGTSILLRGSAVGGHLHLQIVDEGDGIPSDELDQVFDKFHRARKADRIRAGTGLGLAIARGFLDAMKGTITAANRTDRRGAVFVLTLPLAGEASVRSAA